LLPFGDEEHTDTVALSVQHHLVQENIVICFEASENSVCFADQCWSAIWLTHNRDVSGAEKSSSLLFDELYDLHVGNTESDTIRDGFSDRVGQVFRRRGKERMVMAGSVLDLEIIEMISLEEFDMNLTSGFGSFGAFSMIRSMTQEADAVGGGGIAQREFETVGFGLRPEIGQLWVWC
jgi:hypothetical protein